MTRLRYLKSRLRSGRWFHTYRRAGAEASLGVHGLHPTDPRVFAAYCAAHARWETRPPETETPKGGTFAWMVDLHRATDAWNRLKPATRRNREAILRRYVKAQGARPLSSITRDVIEAALLPKGGNVARNERKALRPVFAHAHGLKLIFVDPRAGLKMARPTSKVYATAGAHEIEAFQKQWPIGTTERLIFDLVLYTGAARADLVTLGRKNVRGELLSYARQKTGITADVPITAELRAVLERVPDIAPAFILTSRGKLFTAAGMGNFFADAATAAGFTARLRGLRKAFWVYWAEKGFQHVADRRDGRAHELVRGRAIHPLGGPRRMVELAEGA